jgi:hypothetical protein
MPNLLTDKKLSVVTEIQLSDRVVGVLKAIGKDVELFPFIYTGKVGDYKPKLKKIPKNFILLAKGSRAPFVGVANSNNAKAFLNKVKAEYEWMEVLGKPISNAELMRRVS